MNIKLKSRLNKICFFAAGIFVAFCISASYHALRKKLIMPGEFSKMFDSGFLSSSYHKKYGKWPTNAVDLVNNLPNNIYFNQNEAKSLDNLYSFANDDRDPNIILLNSRDGNWLVTDADGHVVFSGFGNSN